jgi:predicted RNA-binding Zn ribbon-like protein
MGDPEFILLGDAVWIDFINTARDRVTAVTDRLADAPAYHRWTKAEKIASDADNIAFTDVIALRLTLLGLAEALAAGRQPPSSCIQDINRVLATATGHHQLTRVRGEWRLRFAPSHAPTATDAIVRSAAKTLADPGAHVRQCAAPTCSLYFVDSTPGHVRRWCSDETCGQPVLVERRRALR